MQGEKPVKHQIRDRLRKRGAAYAVATLAVFIGALYAKSAVAMIAAGGMTICVVLYVIVNEQNTKKND